jgi:hypothetical protein
MKSFIKFSQQQKKSPFFFQICDIATGYHSEVELAKFDHRSQEESRFLKKSYYLNITISAFFSSKSGDFGALF